MMKMQVPSLKHGVLRFINRFLPKEDNSFLFIPHRNCINDCYDIINYTADNALVLCHYLLENKDFNGHIYLAYYDTKKQDQYLNYLERYRKDISLLDGNNPLAILKAFFKCRTIFTCHPHYDFSHRVKNQQVVSLGYFSPFKDDYYAIKTLSLNKRDNVRKIINRSFTSHIVTSDLCGRIISTDTLLEYDRFKDLGFPRNDVFYHDNSEKRKSIIEIIGCNVNKIICYTPTYRDNERLDLPLGDKNNIFAKTIWGSDNVDKDKIIESLLEETNSVVVVKLHPWQEKSVLIPSNSSRRVLLYSELRNSIDISLYDLLSVSDCLITDYTSTAFDYMNANKPIIFFMYDYERYMNNRGFSLNPVSAICGGAICFNLESLVDNIRLAIDGNDIFAEKRQVINDLINRYQDGNSCERIFRYVSSKS